MAKTKETVQTDKQRSTNHTYKTKDGVTRTPLKPGGELRGSGRVNSSCSSSGTRRVNLVSHEWGKDREVFTTSGTYPWSFVTPIFHIYIYNLEIYPFTTGATTTGVIVAASIRYKVIFTNDTQYKSENM